MHVRTQTTAVSGSSFSRPARRTSPRSLRGPPSCRDCRRCGDEPLVPVTYPRR